MLILLLFLKAGIVQAQLSGVYQSYIPDPHFFGRHTVHRLDFISDSLVLYSHFPEQGQSHCDSVFPSLLQKQDAQIVLFVPGYEPWILKYNESKDGQILTRADGMVFLKKWNPSSPYGDNPNLKGKVKKKAEPCPDF